MQMAAAFFESRRLASMLNATTEFEKMEGITVDTKRRVLYFDTTSITKGMLSTPQYRVGGWWLDPDDSGAAGDG